MIKVHFAQRRCADVDRYFARRAAGRFCLAGKEQALRAAVNQIGVTE
jgi:hypothetical protein